MPCGPMGCGSRFSAYPCTPPGPPRLDANNNVIPYSRVLCGTEVCAPVGNFRDYVLVGNTTSIVNPAALDVFGEASVYGTLTISNVGSPSGISGLSLGPGTSFVANTDLSVGATPTGVGGSLVFAKGGGVTQPTRGGRLDVVFDNATGATTATGFRYENQPPLWYLNGGTGVYYEEKMGSALADAGPAPVQYAAESMLTTVVLSAPGSAITQLLQANTGLFGRVSNATYTQWGLWTALGAWTG